MKISIAIIEPEHEINAGYIARVMKNFGLNDLLFVKPKFDIEKARLFAVHGKDVLERAKTVDMEYLKKFELLVGTTAIGAKNGLNVVRHAMPPEKLASILGKNLRICIILGRESTGLTNSELKMCNVIVSIDTPSGYNTLNISHALAILLYELVGKGDNRKCVCSKSERELLMKYALALAEKSDYRFHKKEKLRIALERIISRSSPTSKEVMLLVSLLRNGILTIDRIKKQQMNISIRD